MNIKTNIKYNILEFRKLAFKTKISKSIIILAPSTIIYISRIIKTNSYY